MPPTDATSATSGTVFQLVSGETSPAAHATAKHLACRCDRPAHTDRSIRRPSRPDRAKPSLPQEDATAPGSDIRARANAPSTVGAVFEQHVHERVTEKRVAAHGLRARHRQHRGRQRIRDLIFDNARRLTRIRGADNDLHVRQIGQRVERRAGREITPQAATITVASSTKKRLAIDQ